MGASLGAVGHLWMIAKRRMVEDKPFAQQVLKYILKA